MPHVVVEYTDNIVGETDIKALLRTIAAVCADSEGYLPVAGIRVRGIRLTEYVIADDKPEYAFVNVTVKIGQGRDEEFKKRFFTRLFEAIKGELAVSYAARPLALSMYVEQIDEAGAYRHNGVRAALGLPQK